MSSQALTTTWVVDAALFEPPATGTGGRSLSPRCTVTSVDRKAERVGGGDGDRGVGAGANLMRRHRHVGLAATA